MRANRGGVRDRQHQHAPRQLQDAGTLVEGERPEHKGADRRQQEQRGATSGRRWGVAMATSSQPVT
jgi:hypothetical protein